MFNNRMPDSARVRQPNPPDQPWIRVPRHAVTAEERANARLLDVAQRIRKGDRSKLLASARLVVGTTSRSEKPVGTTSRGETPGCNHYLPANRFDWWDTQAPETDSIRIRPGASTPTQALRDEFCSPLSTIVGSHLSGLPPSHYNRTISWEDLAENTSPNDVPGIEFMVRQAPPESLPILRTVLVEVGGRADERKILINGTQEGQDLDPNQQRPSLFIDFPAPQRAVGLEFGFLGDADRIIGANRVRLIARDRGGAILVESSAADIRLGGNLEANTVFNVIGVRHNTGDIRSVELAFLQDPDDPIVEPQIVLRIWHEPLPPAVVTQGTLAIKGGPESHEPPRPDVISLPAPVALGPKFVELPFRCNRALVMLRGFRLDFLDQSPHEISAIGIAVNPRPAGIFGGSPTGIFEVEPGGIIRLELSGMLTSNSPDASGYLASIYYTLLAWDSEQVDLFTSEVTTAQGGLDQGVIIDGSAHTPDPSQIFANEMDGIDPNSVFGPIGGVMQEFEFFMSQDQEVTNILLALGVMGGECAGRDFDLQHQNINLPHLERQSQSLDWQICSFLEGAETAYSRSVRGTLITGRSFTTGVAATQYGLAGLGRRRTPGVDWWMNSPLPIPRETVIEGDLAFIGLSTFAFRPDGPVGEIEIELLGIDFDGATLTWQFGGGMSTGLPISNDEPVESSYDADLAACPVIGALVRTISVALNRLTIQDLQFSGSIGLVSLSPVTFGAIHNVGNVATLISSARKVGPQAEDFDIRLEYRGLVFPLSELPSHSPLLLNPDETLIAGGRFFPQEHDGSNNSLRSAFIDFQTNQPGAPQIRMNVLGRVEAQEPMGLIEPSTINFGYVPVTTSAPRTHNVLLASTGHTPLLVQSLTLDDENLGFAWGVLEEPQRTGQSLGIGSLYQIDPGDAFIFQISFRPAGNGHVETRLVAETNAGHFEVRLIAEGVE